MNPLIAYYQSSIGKKTVVAVTGLLLIGFVIVHLLGNLTIFLGPAALNSYADKLHSLGPVLWLFRIGLAAIFVSHIVATIQLARENRAARTPRYEHEKTVQAGRASRTMVVSGLILLSFLIFHILHFTVKVTNPEIAQFRFDLDGKDVPDVFTMVVLGFQNVWVSGFYLLSMGLLCAHLSHGFSSVFQSLGVRNKTRWPLLAVAAHALGWTLFLGNAAIVSACLFEWIEPLHTL
ncbi:MAG: succinate dehydrogenase cytochrome b subunit [Verrucomicrobiales bacterium]